MLGEANKRLAKQEQWQAKAKSKVDKTEAELNKRFQELL